MGYYEIVTAGQDKCTVLAASDDREVCIRAVDTYIKEWMRGWGINNVHLWLLSDGSKIEDIYVRL